MIFDTILQELPLPYGLYILRPLWFVAVLPIMWILWRLAKAEPGDNMWRGVVDAHLLPHLLIGTTAAKSPLPLWLLGLGSIIGIVALAGPVWQRLPQPVYQTQTALVIALDLSPTMNATDIRPSRLAQARFKILDLLQRTREGQVALLAYGAEPFIVSPLTADAATIAAQVPNLDTTLLPVSGSSRADIALTAAEQLLQAVPDSNGQVLLVTDGLDHPAAAQEVALRLRADGYKISVLGIGTEQGAPATTAEGGFLKDTNGAIVIARLQRDTLTALASTGGGRYMTITTDDQDLTNLFPPQQELTTKQQSNKQHIMADQWREEGPLLLLLLLPIAALAFRRGWVGPLLLLCYLTITHRDIAADGGSGGVPHISEEGSGGVPHISAKWFDLWQRPDQQAAQALAAGDPKAAASRFQNPDWQAAAHYQAGDYAQALALLEHRQDSDAHYNRGNALAHLGRFQEAKVAYEQAIAAQPQHEDAIANRDLMQRLLEQQQQEQQKSHSQTDQQSQKDQSQEGGRGGVPQISADQQTQSGQESKTDAKQSSAQQQSQASPQNQNDQDHQKSAKDQKSQIGQKTPDQAVDKPASEQDAEPKPASQSKQQDLTASKKQQADQSPRSASADDTKLQQPPDKARADASGSKPPEQQSPNFAPHESATTMITDKAEASDKPDNKDLATAMAQPLLTETPAQQEEREARQAMEYRKEPY